MRTHWVGCVLISAIVVALGCSPDEAASEIAIPVKVPIAPAQATPPVVPSTFADIDLATVEMTFEGTDFYRPCAEYKLRIHGDGRVEYYGAQLVRQLGDREGHIDEQAVRELLERFDPDRFFAREDVTDTDMHGRGMRFGLRIGERQKKIRQYQSGPTTPEHAELDALRAAIEDAVDIERWIGSADERSALSEARRNAVYYDPPPKTKFAPW